MSGDDPTHGARILVVDDDPDLLGAVVDYLAAYGYAAAGAEDGAAARALIAERRFDLALLDLRMPGEDGLSLTRFIRDTYDIGIIMLTAADEPVDKVVGLEVGADDYLTKPVNMRELLARVRTVLRRSLREDDAVAAGDDDRPRFGRFALDRDQARLVCADGEEHPLTKMEVALLETLAARPNRVLTRDQLLDLAHGRPPDPFDRSVDNRIMRLRRKFEEDPAHPRILRTVRGVGYIYVPG